MSLSLLGDRLALMADQGWEVHVVVGEQPPERQRIDGRVSVHLIPMSRKIDPFSDLRALRHWSRLVKEVQPTHVIGATPKAGFLSMLASWRRRIPHRILEVWGAKWDGSGGSRNRLLRSADRLAVWASTATIAVSPSLADLMVANGIGKARPLVLLYGGTQGVDTIRFSPKPKIVRESGSHVIGFVGRLEADKGLSDLRAVTELVARRFPKLEVHIAGEIDEADLLDESTSLWLDGDPHLRRAGQVDDVPSFLQGLDILCFPSHREGLPNAVIEAAACGLPTVAWDVTGSRDAVLDGLTGYLIPYGDVGAMADRLCDLIGNSDLRKQMGDAARTFACSQFESRSVQGAYVDYLGQL
ncbi:MAG: glycosyltransferase family 4 protein [Candidatus Nanopelagicales bacterium]